MVSKSLAKESRSRVCLSSVRHMYACELIALGFQVRLTNFSIYTVFSPLFSYFLSV